MYLYFCMYVVQVCVGVPPSVKPRGWLTARILVMRRFTLFAEQGLVEQVLMSYLIYLIQPARLLWGQRASVSLVIALQEGRHICSAFMKIWVLVFTYLLLHLFNLASHFKCSITIQACHCAFEMFLTGLCVWKLAPILRVLLDSSGILGNGCGCAVEVIIYSSFLSWCLLVSVKWAVFFFSPVMILCPITVKL